MRAAIFVICMLFAAPASGQAANDYWVLGTISGPDGNVSSVTLADANRVTVNGELRRAWIETYYGPDQRNGLGNIASSVEIDCSQRRMRTLEVAGRYRDGHSETSTHGPSAWSDIASGTGGEFTLRFVCGTRDDLESWAYHLESLAPEAAAALLLGSPPG